MRAVDIWKHRQDSDISRLNRAELLCFKLSQKGSFSEEIELLLKSKSISRKSRILSLNPMIDAQGILRVGGRLSKFSVEKFVSKPIILDTKKDEIMLLIKHFHESFYHGSHQTVLNEISQIFFI